MPLEEMSEQEKIDAFLAGGPIAVVGASQDRAKYGNKVLRSYLDHGREAIPVNPTADEVEGRKAYPNLSAIPSQPHGVSVITPPQVSEKVIEEAAGLGIRHVWLQPGAESDAAIRQGEALGLNLIAGGPCVMVTIGGPTDRDG